MSIKWENIPIPEGYVIPFVLGVIAQQSIPRPLIRVDWYRSLGILLVLMGIFLVNTKWVALLFTFVLAYTHYRVILREEEELERLFGQEYKAYWAKVRRHF